MRTPGDLRYDPAGRDSPARKPGMPGHAEWLIDESIAETFPASDPTAPVRPGSTVAMHYSRGGSSQFARDLEAAFAGPRGVWATLGLSVLIIGVLLARRAR
jgi:hypothetical protein